MIGQHSNIIIADAYIKGAKNFNVSKAYQGILTFFCLFFNFREQYNRNVSEFYSNTKPLFYQ